MTVPIELWTRILTIFVFSQGVFKKRYDATRTAKSVCGLWLHIIDSNVVFATNYYLKVVEEHGVVLPLYRPTDTSKSIRKVGDRGVDVALNVSHIFDYQVVIADTYLRPIYKISNQWLNLMVRMGCRMWGGKLKEALESAHALQHLTVASIDFPKYRPYRLLNILNHRSELKLHSLLTLKIQGRLNSMPRIVASNLIELELRDVSIDLDEYCHLQAGLSKCVTFYFFEFSRTN